ncbi:hypothetical protein TNCV_2149341 [Trichonephila clavipes]|nr:hypothetical protein TNCV_2149341 [Trichonephila clavipes]
MIGLASLFAPVEMQVLSWGWCTEKRDERPLTIPRLFSLKKLVLKRNRLSPLNRTTPSKSYCPLHGAQSYR